jgi:hypothetical protein
MQPHEYIISEALKRLSKSPELADSSRVTLIGQNSASLAEAIEKSLDAVDNVAAVVCVDRVAYSRTKPRVANVEFSLRCTENVPVNRTKADFLTALDVAFFAVDALDGDFSHADDVTHSTPGEGVLEATAKFSTTIQFD